MRERNNEASKRCRLKRRMKAVSMEQQANLLLLSNQRLKKRMVQLEKITKIIKNGVEQIGLKQCICHKTVSLMEDVLMQELDDGDNKMSTNLLLANSVSCRSKPTVMTVSSEEEEIKMDTNSNCQPSIVLAPVQNIIKTTSTPFLADVNGPKLIAVGKPKTALDVINDTIVESLRPTMASNEDKPHQVSPVNPTIPMQRSSSSSEIVIKCEPEVQILDSQDEIGVDPTSECIAFSHLNSSCAGEKLDLNKLNGYLDLNNLNPTTAITNSAMERAILKSRLGIPFWQADEVISYHILNVLC